MSSYDVTLYHDFFELTRLWRKKMHLCVKKIKACHRFHVFTC